MKRTIQLATSPAARMKGLLGRSGLPVGEALLLRPCNAIHTLRMQFAIDARFYDKRGHLVREVLGIPPGKWWVWGGWRAHSVLECAAGDVTFHGCKTLTEAAVRKDYDEGSAQ